MLLLAGCCCGGGACLSGATALGEGAAPELAGRAPLLLGPLLVCCCWAPAACCSCCCRCCCCAGLADPGRAPPAWAPPPPPRPPRPPPPPDDCSPLGACCCCWCCCPCRPPWRPPPVPPPPRPEVLGPASRCPCALRESIADVCFHARRWRCSGAQHAARMPGPHKRAKLGCTCAHSSCHDGDLRRGLCMAAGVHGVQAADPARHIRTGATGRQAQRRHLAAGPRSGKHVWAALTVARRARASARGLSASAATPGANAASLGSARARSGVTSGSGSSKAATGSDRSRCVQRVGQPPVSRRCLPLDISPPAAAAPATPSVTRHQHRPAAAPAPATAASASASPIPPPSAAAAAAAPRPLLLDATPREGRRPCPRAPPASRGSERDALGVDAPAKPPRRPGPPAQRPSLRRHHAVDPGRRAEIHVQLQPAGAQGHHGDSLRGALHIAHAMSTWWLRRRCPLEQLRQAWVNAAGRPLSRK